MWDYFLRVGIKAEELDFFVQNPCPPDLMGVNHYVTSERYLDEKMSIYPYGLNISVIVDGITASCVARVN